MKYKVKDLKKCFYNIEVHGERLIEPLTLITKWTKNDVEKYKLAAFDGYEYVIEADNLEQIKTESNIKNKK
tara:strand:+ start:400 stop:612 length:213 start_codon:yes stop_codon:yes gene_type:complete